MSRRNALLLALLLALVTLGGVGYTLYAGAVARTARLLRYLNHPEAYAAWQVPARIRCGDAPFLFPTTGYIGYLWGDLFRPWHPHQGIDIFGGTAPGVTPVYAAYDGYLTRLPTWKASLIIRHQDPLHPDRPIWTYYTHLADAEGRSLIDPTFPPGTREVFVRAGTLLGYQGNYSGTPGRPVGVHLHFSIVLDDGQGGFRNEWHITNTLDPSPYLGLPLRATRDLTEPPRCPEDQIHPWEADRAP